MAKAKKTEVDQCMAVHLDEIRGDWDEEYQFHPERRWRFDFVIIGPRIAIEIDGGIWIQGRHTRGSGQTKDNEKFNEAARLGWRVLKFAPSQVLDGTAIAFIKRVIDSTYEPQEPSGHE